MSSLGVRAPIRQTMAQEVHEHDEFRGSNEKEDGQNRLAGEQQVRQALSNCEAVLRAGGASLDDVVEVGVLLASPADFAGMNEEYAKWFEHAPPARYVAKLGVELPGVLVSIRMTACVS